jgi:Catalytic LigB subunit of aromatic ring-opening dioxygenase
VAAVVAAVGASHGPMLSIPPDQWDCFALTDPHNDELYDEHGTRHNYDELVAEHAARVAGEVSIEKWRALWQSWQDSVANLAGLLDDAEPDLVVVVGNDQRESVYRDNQPSVLLHVGSELIDTPIDSDEKVQRRARSRARDLSEWAYSPTEQAGHPGAPAFGEHLIRTLLDAGFDPSTTDTWPGERSIGHAFGFVYQRLLAGREVPALAISLNTFYPPNQPAPSRCVALGRVVAEALHSFPGAQRAAVIASGGLSHHLVDEELDRRVITALRDRDLDALASLPSESLRGGSSEIRNWITMAPVAHALPLRIADYSACYRNNAGIGSGTGFFGWSA